MDPDLPRWTRRVPAACGAIALGAALIALVGWGTGLGPLTSLVPGWATLKVNTAICFGLLGLALALPRRSRAGLALGAVAGGIAVLTGLEWALDVDLGLDEWIVSDRWSRESGAPPGRMAAATALGLSLAAAGVLAARLRPAWATQLSGAAVLAIAWVALVGYAYELGPLSRVWLYGTVSLPTAIALLSLGFGLLALRPAEGPMLALTGPGDAARMLRLLGPAAVLLPAVTGFAALRLEQQLGGSVGFALAAGATLDAVAFGGILAATAAVARRAEREVRELARRRLEAHETERRALAQELHDELGQTLTALSLLLDRAGRDERAATEARDLLQALTDGVRSLALDLRPSELDDLGLVAALRALVERWKDRSLMPCALEIEGVVRRLPAPVETAAYRVVQEALTNVARHARARSARVAVRFEEQAVEVEVADDGRGFDPSAPAGVGVHGMRERARVLGGCFSIESPGSGGATVRARLPVEVA